MPLIASAVLHRGGAIPKMQAKSQWYNGFSPAGQKNQ